MDYTDYSGGTTTYSATSRGLFWGNLDYNCCTDEEGGCDCTNTITIQQGSHPYTFDLGVISLLGNGNLGPWTYGYPYVQGDIVTWPSSRGNWDCCYVCIDGVKCEANDPSFDTIWGACTDCTTPGGGGSNRINTTGDRPPHPIDPDELYRCAESSCSQIPKPEITMSGNTYASLLSQPNVYKTMSECEAACGCTNIQELELTITNPTVCSAFVDNNAWNLNCDGVVQIVGFDEAESSQYTITNHTTGEVKIITPTNGYYSGVIFDNLCPTSYSSVGGAPAGLYNFTIEDTIGCTTTKTISVEPDPLYFTVIDGGGVF